MIHPRTQRLIEYLAIAALLVTFFGFFSVKVWDIDFWWHIAAGKSILANGAIPNQDPFGVYDASSNWGQTILKSEWLGQVLLYLVYSFFGLDGVIFLRATVLTACLGIAYWRCRIAGARPLFTMIMLALAGMVILSHTGERPQLFSFLYFSLVFLLLDMQLKTARRWPLYLIPLIFLLWANTHGGVLLGIAVAGLFCVGFLLENRLVTGSYHSSQNRLILVVMGLSIVAFLLAPNGLGTLKALVFIQNTPVRERVSEYATPWTLWATTKFYWMFFAVGLVSLPGFLDRTYLKQTLVICLVAALSLTGYRYTPWFVLLATPYFAASLSRIFRRVKLPDTTTSLAVLAIAILFFAYGHKQNRIFQHGMLEARYPEAAVAFIKEKHLSGRMLNALNWGGYLIWNLSPTVTVFIDGRHLDIRHIEPYTHMLWMTPEGKRFFEQLGFDLVLVPHSNSFTGEKYPLIGYLLKHPDWKVAYQDETGYLFTRAK